MKKNRNITNAFLGAFTITLITLSYVVNAQEIASEVNSQLDSNMNPTVNSTLDQNQLPPFPDLDFPDLPTPPSVPDIPEWHNNWPPNWPPMPNPNPGNGSTSTSSVKVMIYKFIDGSMAMASTSNNQSFDMYATYNSTNTGMGTGTYALSPTGYGGTSTPYQAMTIGLNPGASYSTYEIMNANVGNSCGTSTSSSSKPFALIGYTVGNSFNEAKNATPTISVPTLNNMTSDKYIIVWNDNCTTATPGNGSGQIGGDVTGGATTSTSTIGVLKVNSIDTLQGTAVANGTFDSGWKHVFNITVPTNEPNLYMKFSDWVNNSNSSSLIPVTNNVRVSSQQASATSTVLITGSNLYTTVPLNIVADLDSVLPGKQIKVLVETSVPANTVNGSYTTTYGVKSQ